MASGGGASGSTDLAAVPRLKKLPMVLKEVERLIKNREQAGAMISH